MRSKIKMLWDFIVFMVKFQGRKDWPWGEALREWQRMSKEG